MAELRQIAIDGKRIKEAVEAVETKSIYTAGDNVTISDGVISATDTTYTAGDNVSITDGVISATDTTYTAGTGISISDGVISAQSLEEGIGIDISNNKINIDDIPTVTLDTELTGSLREHVEVKNLPIKIRSNTTTEYILYAYFINPTTQFIYYRSVNVISTTGFPAISVLYAEYNPTTHKFPILQTKAVGGKAQNSLGGTVKIYGDNTTAVNARTTVAGRTYGVELTSDGHAVVNVPWESGGTAKYKHHVVITIDGTALDVMSGVIFCDIINSSSTVLTDIPETDTDCYGQTFHYVLNEAKNYFDVPIKIRKSSTSAIITAYPIANLSTTWFDPLLESAVTLTSPYTVISDTVTEI